MQRRPFPDRSTEETQNPQAVGAPLEQRVAEALNDNAAGITSAAIAALYNEVAAAITAATAAVATAKINALDPTVVDPAAARARRDDCAFQLERLKAALAPLQARYAQLRQAERRAQWRVDYARIEAERDAAATSLKNIYGEFTTKLIDALLAAKAIDEDIARINSTAPNGEPDRLLTTECCARGVGVGPNAALSLLTELKLPRFSAPGWLWPPPTPPIDVRQIVPAGMFSHPGANWHEELQQRDARRQQEAERMAAYYRDQQRQREERDTAEARAAQERRRQPAP
jgi:hypothetical protein